MSQAELHVVPGSPSSHQTFTRLVEMPPSDVAHLLNQNRQIVQTLEKSLVPFRFQTTATSKGIRIDGDNAAVMIVARVLERAVKGVPRDGSDATITPGIEYALQHDLPFLLKGLPRPVRPSSLCQVAYMSSLLSPDTPLTLAIGPTGTGKTHLAIAAGLNLLAEEAVKHFVITKPHVRAVGEEITAAVRSETRSDGQFTYVEDILHDLVGHARYEDLVASRALEIAPLGRLRGRTFNDAFVLIDEAQNMTIGKMRMAVTRIGRNARMVITGDPSQIDLYDDGESGLPHLLRMIERTDLAMIHKFETCEIVRSDLARRLEELYAQDGGDGRPRV